MEVYVDVICFEQFALLVNVFYTLISIIEGVENIQLGGFCGRGEK